MKANRYCPIRDEQITAEECAGIILNATQDTLDQCLECEHGKAKRGTSPLAAAPRVEEMPQPPPRPDVEPTPVEGYEAAEQASARSKPPVEVRVQVAESVASATGLREDQWERLPDETAWEYVSRCTGIETKKALAQKIRIAPPTLYWGLQRLDQDKSAGTVPDKICSKYPAISRAALVSGPSARVAEDHTEVGEGVDEDIREAETAQRQALESPAQPQEREPRPGEVAHHLQELARLLPGVRITLAWD